MRRESIIDKTRAQEAVFVYQQAKDLCKIEIIPFVSTLPEGHLISLSEVAHPKELCRSHPSMIIVRRLRTCTLGKSITACQLRPGCMLYLHGGDD